MFGSNVLFMDIEDGQEKDMLLCLADRVHEIFLAHGSSVFYLCLRLISLNRHTWCACTAAQV
jgi:hypothetical protein